MFYYTENEKYQGTLLILLLHMEKLLDFGRKAMFYVRVLSGYEERRIRSYRMALQKHIQQAQAQKDELRKIPEKTILREVRTMVEEMQELNRELEKAEARIEEHFKPVDEQAHVIMNMQLDKEEKHMKEMMKMMREQAALHKEMAEKQEGVTAVDVPDIATTIYKQQEHAPDIVTTIFKQQEHVK